METSLSIGRKEAGLGGLLESGGGGGESGINNLDGIRLKMYEQTQSPLTNFSSLEINEKTPKNMN